MLTALQIGAIGTALFLCVPTMAAEYQVRSDSGRGGRSAAEKPTV